MKCHQCIPREIFEYGMVKEKHNGQKCTECGEVISQCELDVLYENDTYNHDREKVVQTYIKSNPKMERSLVKAMKILADISDKHDLDVDETFHYVWGECARMKVPGKEVEYYKTSPNGKLVLRRAWRVE